LPGRNVRAASFNLGSYQNHNLVNQGGAASAVGPVGIRRSGSNASLSGKFIFTKKGKFKEMKI